jgi:hypothetical protein
VRPLPDGHNQPALEPANYAFQQRFPRTRIHFNKEISPTTTVDQRCELTDQERYVALVDNNGAEHMTFTCKIEPAEYRRAVWLAMRPRMIWAAVGLMLLLFAVALYSLLTSGEDLAWVLF